MIYGTSGLRSSSSSASSGGGGKAHKLPTNTYVLCVRVPPCVRCPPNVGTSRKCIRRRGVEKKEVQSRFLPTVVGLSEGRKKNSLRFSRFPARIFFFSFAQHKVHQLEGNLDVSREKIFSFLSSSVIINEWKVWWFLFFLCRWISQEEKAHVLHPFGEELGEKCPTKRVSKCDIYILYPSH